MGNGVFDTKKASTAKSEAFLALPNNLPLKDFNQNDTSSQEFCSALGSPLLDGYGWRRTTPCAIYHHGC